MIADEDREMNVAWGRALIGIGVIVALLALGALEMLTARLPADEVVLGQARPDSRATGSSEDVLELRP
jgi:hypothetical protein